MTAAFVDRCHLGLICEADAFCLPGSLAMGISPQYLMSRHWL